MYHARLRLSVVWIQRCLIDRHVWKMNTSQHTCPQFAATKCINIDTTLHVLMITMLIDIFFNQFKLKITLKQLRIELTIHTHYIMNFLEHNVRCFVFKLYGLLTYNYVQRWFRIVRWLHSHRLNIDQFIELDNNIEYWLNYVHVYYIIMMYCNTNQFGWYVSCNQCCIQKFCETRFSTGEVSIVTSWHV